MSEHAKTSRIAISDAVPGMYTVNPGVSWLEYPMLYMQEGFLTTQSVISDIARQGYTEICHDPSRFRQYHDLNAGLSTANIPWPGLSVSATSLGDEIPRARSVYADAFEHIRELMSDTQGKPVDMTAARPCVEAVIRSLNRNRDALIALTKLKKNDKDAHTHSVNVAIIAIAYAQYLGLPQDKLPLVGLAGLFHDYGKIFIPQVVLNAPRKLTPAERTIMQAHVELGHAHLAREQDANHEILQGVLQHHEKYNGTGYPNRLKGNTISIYGLILSLSDHYDALSSQRVYKDPMPANVALAVMYKMRNQVWAPGYVERFIKMLGIYPTGTPVQLSNGERGVVCHTSPDFPALPTVIVALDPDGRSVRPRLRDLSEESELEIERSLAGADAEQMDIGLLLSQT
ncbi:MAG: HD-GYP domain-containing protein [Desulfovibrio sp.]|uniref:HD-GYP domain-containing protein n=1 Tax=Desulfovibrio sp. TaxID=885 RepID=UPI002A35DFF1|nr:HD-GYP domain-containing protein [Desulfovibrio sp.]MDY0259237.1 HD-GYP domain-containing protein [Desulfovibrio sp.]